MCNVVLAGSDCEFKHLNKVNVLPDRIDVYDYQNKLIMTLPQGNQNRKDFEALGYVVLNCFDSSIEFPDKNDIIESITWRSFYNPAAFQNEMKYCCDSLRDSLKMIDHLKRVGVNISGMAKIANDHWSTHGKA
jgi:hypothetical protein